jgi:hypothetical protein
MMNRACAIAILCLAAELCAAQAKPAAQSSAYSIRSKVDWRARTLSIDIELDLAAAGLKMPDARLAAERMIERDLPGLAKDAVFSLQADSYRSVEDAVADGSFDPERLIALTDLARPGRLAFTGDMRKFQAAYSLDLDSIAALFPSSASSAPIRVPLESRPTRAYTGIVIYAKGLLPVHGEAADGRAAPCLFPRIFDSLMNPVLDKTLVLPEDLAEGGVLGYTDAMGVAAGERVGSDPMRVMAVGLFGDKRTDYLISRDDALRILSSADNRALLREGKVVVVLGD